MRVSPWLHSVIVSTYVLHVKDPVFEAGRNTNPASGDNELVYSSAGPKPGQMGGLCQEGLPV